MMKFEQQSYDLLVVGGGIYGVWTAYDASMRGLKVALIEQNDWGCGTSSASSKLIHGGLRYLEHGWIRLVKKSIQERQRLLALAPHRVQRLRFFMPIYENSRIGQLRGRIGLTLYDWIAGKSTLPKHQYFNHKDIQNELPFLQSKDLIGGFSFFDAFTDDARYALEIALGARSSGAHIMNHAEVIELCESENKIYGAIVKNAQSTFEIKASQTILTCGPWLNKLWHNPKQSHYMLTKGTHIVLPALRCQDALLLTNQLDGRVFFMIPWYGKTLLGTTDTIYDQEANKINPSNEDINYLFSAVQPYFQSMMWSLSDIQGAFSGLRVLIDQGGSSTPSSISREWKLEHPMAGLWTPIGGKLTSARMDAAYTIDRIMESLDLAPKPTQTDQKPFPWAPQENFEIWSKHTIQKLIQLGLDQESARSLPFRYGSTLSSIELLLTQNPSLAGRISPSQPFIWAEIVHAIKHEMATTLEDILRRRIPLLILEKLSDESLSKITQFIAKYLDWTPEMQKQEIAKIQKLLMR